MNSQAGVPAGRIRGAAGAVAVRLEGMIRLEKKSVKDIARAVVEKELEGTVYELVDVQFKSERGKWHLNIYVDKPGGITLSDCETVNHLVDPALDREPAIAGRHDYLTVSSPGLDRPIREDGDWRRNLGRAVDVKLFTPVEKSKEVSGVLEGFDAENVYLAPGGGAAQVAVKRSNIAKAQQHIEF